MIVIRYYASLQDMSTFKLEYDIELNNDSLAKYMNVDDIIFGNDDEEYNYKVKYKNYDPISDNIHFRVYRV
ncbi:MAG: hypothetical protein RBT59_06625 [Arcobacteraceae bacterium]|jgi:hypothetical protein|nr:hypothetical protein [Arcobacteraceae bacterium]